MVFAPLLTILIFVWLISTTYRYVVTPVTYFGRETILRIRDDVKTATEVGVRTPPEANGPPAASVVFQGRRYCRVGQSAYVPEIVYDTVEADPGEPRPTTARAYCRRYIDLTMLRPYYTIPFILSVFILLLYLLGKFMAAGIGRFFWHRFELGIHRLPLIRNVYSSVKQVSDFLFTEREIEYTRVVAVEYPRKGIWSLGMVTGESMLDIRSAANEPVLSVLMPTSPMPMTGFTVTVLKSETIDLNITIDQAFQFIVSCGVVVPPQQLQELQRSQQTALAGPADSTPP
ncbi:MAG: DUF502 domain-containing protein [Pirellulales bacterium]|nr:DUF502 domain-containing protein [Pirellulales bacterium]